jgi:hypothetical protein
MTDRTLFDWGPLVAVLALVAFVLDWSLTHVGARAFRAVRHVWDAEGSYEMNPTWRAEIDSGRWFSWRAVAAGAILVSLIVAMWLVIDLGGLDAAFFALAAGVVLLLQAPTLLMHAGNLQTFRALADPTAVTGALHLRRWFLYHQSAWAYLRFGALWLVLAALSRQAFFLGGALGCVLFGWRLLRLSRAARRDG